MGTRAHCFFLLAASLSAGCMVGPDFHTPKSPDLPDRWINPSAPPTTQTSTTTQRPIDIVRWWRTFNDPVLDSLVSRAMDTNLDLQQAEARLRQARATRGMVGAALLPQIDLNSSYTRSGFGRGNVQSSPIVNGGTSNTAFRTNYYQAGFDSNWEVDIWGGLRRNLESADASVEAAVWNRRDTLVTLVSEVATDYIALRGYQRQIKIAEDNVVSEQHTADLTRKKFGAGFVSKLDVANADATVFTTQADIPALETSAMQTIYAISVLLGQEPGALLKELSAGKPIPPSPPDVPIGMPGELLRRRPDIRSAESQLHAATAQIGVAQAQLYPQINLLGSLNLETNNLHGLGTWASNVWSLGPSVTWPIFAGGRIVASIQVQNALQQQALLTYRQTVLNALQDVESALVGYGKEQARRKALVASVAANQQALDLSTLLYRQGQTDFLNVLNAERSLYVVQTELAQSDTTIATDLAALYKALGGGWEIAPDDDGAPATRPATLP